MIRRKDMPQKPQLPEAKPDSLGWFGRLAQQANSYLDDLRDNPAPKVTTTRNKEGAVVASVGDTLEQALTREQTKRDLKEYGGDRGLERGTSKLIPIVPLKTVKEGPVTAIVDRGDVLKGPSKGPVTAKI
jgi:hypothetical protein